MILKGNQRGGGQQLAVHLLNSFDNEHVEVADMRGAIARDLSGAFNEWYAQSRATRARKYLYSLSLNPDQKQGRLTREQYFELLERTERSLKLVGQPRAVVFHEKRDEQGVLREHCHAVWSRTYTAGEKAKAVQIAHDRLKLRTVARDFCRDHGLELPDGMKPRRSKDRDLFNENSRKENLGERQQKERTGTPKAQRVADIATCWKETGNGAAFVQAMEKKGYLLCQGDRRDYVVIDLHGEVYSLSRQLSGMVRKKDLVERLVDYPADKLPGVEDGQAWAKKQREQIEQQKDQQADKKDQQAEKTENVATDLEKRREALKVRQEERRSELERRQFETLSRHLSERGSLKQMQEAENTGIVSARLQKQPKGLLAFLTRITGIQMIRERRDRQQDAARTELHRQQQEALQRRHNRELQEIGRRQQALHSLEERENRSAETALHREEFQKIAQKVVEINRKPPAREQIKPVFDRVAHQIYQRTGTDDGRAPQTPKEESKPDKGKFTGLFNRIREALKPEPKSPAQDFEKAAKPPVNLTDQFNRDTLNSEPPQQTPLPPLREDFENAVVPPRPGEAPPEPGRTIDLTEEFNREVEYRRGQEERDRDYDGPDTDFDPTDPQR